MRNHILHARPGIAPGGGVALLRLRVGKAEEPEFFWIDEPYLDRVVFDFRQAWMGGMRGEVTHLNSAREETQPPGRSGRP
jgi:hypothetical protein